jgi:flagellar basal body-associated protein FliL
MSKKFVIAAVVFAVLIAVAAVATCFYWFGEKKPEIPPDKLNPTAQTQVQSNVQPADADSDNSGQSASSTEQSLLENIVSSATANPVENKPDINPASQTNPIRKIKTNPFE